MNARAAIVDSTGRVVAQSASPTEHPNIGLPTASQIRNHLGPEPEFIEASVLPCGDGESWRARYLALRERLALPPRIMPDELGPPPRDRDGKPLDPFERCNLWLLYSALSQGLSCVRFVCLWNGGGGDGPAD